MELISLPHKSARGHEYILVMVDYATCYPEAVLLWKATSKNIARLLVFFFSCVGLPKELLTDQGTPFILKLIADANQLLQDKQIQTSV